MSITKVEHVKPGMGTSPAVALVNPKFSRNIGAALRACSAFSIPQLWFSGNRCILDPTRKNRVPREERMKGYGDVSIYQCDYFLDAFPKGTIPVAVELKEGAVQMHEFEHDPRMIYVFGPEDGSVPSTYLRHCHHIVVLPTKHCLNLATAVCTTLYARAACLHRQGISPIPHQDDLLSKDRAFLRHIDNDDEIAVG